MDENETLYSAIKVVDEFYKDTALMLETLKSILINDFSYEDVMSNRITWEGSGLLNYPAYWSPAFLTLWLKNTEDESSYVSITITLKEYWKGRVPKKEYFIYGCKYWDVANPHSKSTWLGRETAESPDISYVRKDMGGYIEVERKEYFSSCKLIKRSLWDMKDRQTVADFAKQVVEL